MSNLYPVAGSHIFLGGVLNPGLTDFTEADFASQTWVEIDGWSQMGSFGDTAALISTDLINRGRTTKQKGTSNAGQMQNVFAIIPGDPGQEALLAASAGGNKNNYAFKVTFPDAPPVKSSTVTITVAAPGVVTWTAHGLANGTPVQFTTTGALPTGLTEGTTYYVVDASANTFSVAATSGGTAITTTGTQSGVHTATTVPAPSSRLFAALVMGANEAGGEANTIRNLSATLEINSNIVAVPALG